MSFSKVRIPISTRDKTRSFAGDVGRPNATCCNQLRMSLENPLVNKKRLPQSQYRERKKEINNCIIYYIYIQIHKIWKVNVTPPSHQMVSCFILVLQPYVRSTLVKTAPPVGSGSGLGDTSQYLRTRSQKAPGSTNSKVERGGNLQNTHDWAPP